MKILTKQFFALLALAFSARAFAPHKILRLNQPFRAVIACSNKSLSAAKAAGITFMMMPTRIVCMFRTRQKSSSLTPTHTLLSAKFRTRTAFTESPSPINLGRGFTSNGRDNSVTVFDLKTLKAIDTIKVGKNPDAIIYDAATNRVFTFNGGSSDSTVIEAASGKSCGNDCARRQTGIRAIGFERHGFRQHRRHIGNRRHSTRGR